MAQVHSSPAANYDFRSPSRRWRSALELVAVVVLFMAGVVWFGGAFPNRDALWFYARFDEQPAYIRIYHYGTVREIGPADSGFGPLVQAVNADIAQVDGYVESLQPRGTSLESYTQKGYAIELVYRAPVQIHTRQFFPAAPRLLIAIDGSYDYIGYLLLFRGSADMWLPNALALKSLDRTRTAVDAILAAASQ